MTATHTTDAAGSPTQPTGRPGAEAAAGATPAGLARSQAWVLTTAGQATPWLSTLTDLLALDRPLARRIAELDAGASALLSPVATELLTVRSRGNRLIDDDGEITVTPDEAAQAHTSVPGIVLSQQALLESLPAAGIDPRRHRPAAVLGHSQGVLAAAALEAWSGTDPDAGHRLLAVHALARLIGAAATQATRRAGAGRRGQATPMMSVRGLRRGAVEELLASLPQDTRDEVSLGVVNGATAFILAGRPQALEVVAAAAQAMGERSAADRRAKRRGGAVLSPVTEFLDTAVPFHTPVLAPALEQTMAWARRCGLTELLGEDYVHDLAAGVLTDHVDWPARLTDAVASTGARLVVDLGPGTVLSRLNQAALAGTGVSIASAGTARALDDLDRPGATPTVTCDRSRFAPSLTTLPDGRVRLDTAFTRLTGRSAVLLAGMTPTTVDPQIVAAAANAGYWAELAGGGQTTPEVLDANLRGLAAQLEPGRTAAFNAMFMDRYLWNLHLGTQRLLSKARASGAPVDGVVISAGVPEPDEAVALVERLRAEGFPYVAFKPGTVEQIRQVLAIAERVAPTPVIMQVEDGHAGGHHSWEDLDTMLLATYDDVRAAANVVLVVGGGIGTPSRAADYLTGTWALAYGTPAAPVDAVMVGTAVMTAKEARTNPDVKELLVATPGLSERTPGAVDGWVASGASAGGMTSGLSHLRADLYEIDNSSAAASRLIQQVAGDEEAMAARREEVIEALGRTAKPYFGDVEDMTYLEWATRYAELCVSPHPGRPARASDWVEAGWYDRFLDLLRRVEARLAPADHGTIETLFTHPQDVVDVDAALSALTSRYPQAATTLVEPADVAWWPQLCRKHPRPVPFVPVLDADILRWWGTDSLWQSQDPRYSADQVRIIPGPVSVAGVTTVDEPVAQILDRFEQAAVDAAVAAGTRPHPALSRLGLAGSVEEVVRRSPHVLWTSHLMTNPAAVLDPQAYQLVHRPEVAEDAWDLDITLDTHWDAPAGRHADPAETQPYAVRRLVVPLRLAGSADGAVPVVDDARVAVTMTDLLRATAGVGSTSTTGDLVSHLPAVEHDGDPERPWGTVIDHVHLSANLGTDHASVAGDALPEGQVSARVVPDALLGPCWPVVYAALGSVVEDGMPLIEGLLGAVHLDHTVDLRVPTTVLEELLDCAASLDVTGWVAQLEDSSAGRVVDVRLELRTAEHSPAGAPGTLIVRGRERFAVRGRAAGSQPPSAPAPAGDTGAEVAPAARRLLRRVRVQAPADMTAFARVTGDYNPIHTSYRAAAVAGMEAPLVHGMWLSATAQQVASAAGGTGTEAGWRLTGWTYVMLGTVDLRDEIEISVERTGVVRGGGLALELVCRKGDEVVSRGTAVTEPVPTAYVYPGQGIQAQGMGLDEMAASPAARAVWERADAHTRSALGFSVIALVRDNPTQLTARGVTYRHPEGLLHLTQFTQVALATVAMASTARLREAGVLVDGAAFAGHSLGEYTALAAYGGVMDIETTLSIVFQRGSTMHTLVARDAAGASGYRMGALRPDQAGIGAEDVAGYVAGIASRTGEFLQIVNYNLAGSQYAVAGTVAGLEALAADCRERSARRGGKNPFMLVPGIDVPFHSSVLRPGVAEFRERLEQMLPAHLDVERLEGRYVPNLVARPFALTQEFCRAVLEVVPSEPIEAVLGDWERAAASRDELARTVLIELLAWQFASPVRWIETQDVLFASPHRGGLGVRQLVEVGLAASPTLANLAARTLALPAHAREDVAVFNARRDEARVYATDTDPAPGTEAAGLAEADGAAGPAQAAQAAEASGTAGAAGASAGAAEAGGSDAAACGPAESAAATPASVVSAAASAPAPGGAGAAGPVEDLRYDATDALTFLLCHAARVSPAQVAATDTTESLTGGVSSRRNQLLMDLGAELQLASIDGAADADMPTLAGIVAQGAPGYQPFGPVLGDVVRTSLGRLLGPAGARVSRVADRVRSTWGLGEGWVAHVTTALVLGTREGASARGGELATLPGGAVTTLGAVDALIDAAVAAVAGDHQVAVSLPQAGTEGGAVVDSAALDAFAAELTGEDGVLATTARTLLAALGLAVPVADAGSEEAVDAAAQAAQTSQLVRAVDAELGSGWLASVTPAFNARRAVLIDDRWASAREDLARLASAELDASDPVLDPQRFTGLGTAVADQAAWWAQRLDEPRRSVASAISAAAQAAPAPGSATVRWAQEVAVVTGVAPGSIAAAVVARLLAGGATVIATASRLSHERLAFATELYRRHAVAGARLWMVPANLASYRDVDALTQWIGTDHAVTAGGTTTLVKPALVPTLLFPFAAPRVSGTLGEAGAAAERQTRLLLWSLERQIAGLSRIGTDTAVDHRLHVVLPGSPNRGTFGGDGAYGEVKAALDAVVNRWHAEADWSGRVTLAHPRIGWVRGTGLMGGNDPLVEAVEAAGVRTWSTEEIAAELLALCEPQVRQRAGAEPVTADLTGGLGERRLDMAGLRHGAAQAAASAGGEDGSQAPEPAAVVEALPTPVVPCQPTAPQWGEVLTRLEDMVVMVSSAEVSAWGSARTRREAELGMTSGEDVELTAAGVVELAWAMGLISWQDSPQAGWYDTDGELVPEERIWARYRDEVVARCGIREMSDDGVMAPQVEIDASVYLEQDVTFTVADEATARSLHEADAEHTVISPAVVDGEATGEWTVTRLAGSLVRVPRRATLTRTVGGQMPEGFDPARWGIPASMIESMDTVAAWNLVTAAGAFLAAGFTPAELLRAVHPGMVASTQGTGFGGMESMRKMFVGRLLDEERPADILQEALPNVVAAHVMQSFVGGYGSMVQPVSACATAAVSVEEAWDKIALGKADVVVAGAIDDISVESVTGFGNMNATAAAADMYAQGISARHFSRANDRRRGGFVEAEGGGTVILARASVAADLGLPVAGVVGYVSSFADGAHTSIPAPGLGALGAGRGGRDSRLARALADLGVAADDVAVVSKHDTSTKANDPNESELHRRLAAALGRSAGNPLVAVSQKSVTGHAKGGAALFQIAGLAEILSSGVAPGNASLDVVDPVLERDELWVWPRRPIRLVAARGDGVVRAGLLTSLGFGHVSGLVALVHPGAFEQALRQEQGEEAVEAWLARANARLGAGARRLRAGMIGRASLFEPVQGRRLGEAGPDRDTHEVEAAMLLDPQARLGADGVFAAVRRA